jgi:hypothetical protein
MSKTLPSDISFRLDSTAPSSGSLKPDKLSSVEPSDFGGRRRSSVVLLLTGGLAKGILIIGLLNRTGAHQITATLGIPQEDSSRALEPLLGKDSAFPKMKRGV